MQKWKYRILSFSISFLVFLMVWTVSDSDRVLALSIADDDSMPVVLVSDGDGGAFIFIDDYNIDYYDWDDQEHNTAFVQHVDATGRFTWPGAGIEIPYYKLESAMTSDGSGGVIIAYAGTVNGVNGIYTQRISSDGRKLWDPDGMLVYEGIGDRDAGWLDRLVLTWGSDGSAIVVWLWAKPNDEKPLFAQKISSSGEIEWDEQGIIITPDSNYYPEYYCFDDGNGGVTVTWLNQRERPPIFHARRIDKSGEFMWDDPELSIGEGYACMKAVSDMQGGVLATCIRSHYISLLRLDGEGNVLWGENDSVRISQTVDLIESFPVSDGNSGMFVVWDYILDTGAEEKEADVYAQRVDENGNFLWDEPVVIADFDYREWVVAVEPDHDDGIFVVWKVEITAEEEKDDRQYLCVNRIDADGNLRWEGYGLNVGRLFRVMRDQSFVSTETGALMVFRQDFNYSNPTLYAQVIDETGEISRPEVSLYPEALSMGQNDSELLVGIELMDRIPLEQPVIIPEENGAGAVPEQVESAPSGNSLVWVWIVTGCFLVIVVAILVFMRFRKS